MECLIAIFAILALMTFAQGFGGGYSKTSGRARKRHRSNRNASSNVEAVRNIALLDATRSPKK